MHKKVKENKMKIIGKEVEVIGENITPQGTGTGFDSGYSYRVSIIIDDKTVKIEEFRNRTDGFTAEQLVKFFLETIAKHQ